MDLLWSPMCSRAVCFIQAMGSRLGRAWIPGDWMPFRDWLRDVWQSRPWKTEVTDVIRDVINCYKISLCQEVVCANFLRSRSAEVSRGQPRSAEVSRRQPRSAEVSRGQPRSAEVSRGQPRSAEVSRGQPTSAEVSRGQPRSAEVSRGQPRSADQY